MAKYRNGDGFPELATIIGQNGDFEGRLVVKHSVRIDGRMKGNITTTETVTIGQSGQIEGDIIAKDVIIGGKVVGSIKAEGKVTLEESSTFKGELKTKKLVIVEGAVFNGSTEMGDNNRSIPKPLPPE